MPKFSKKELNSSRFQEITQRLTNRAKVIMPPVKTSFWNRFFYRLVKTFNKTYKEEKSLAGRIQQLTTNSDELVAEIESIQNELINRNDTLLYSFLNTIIRPLLKERQSILNAFHSSSAAKQAKAFKNHGEWMERADRWVRFYARSANKEKIIQAIIEQSLKDSFKHIERDLQIIHEYLIHQVENLLLTQDNSEKLYLQLDKKITPFTTLLHNLRKVPDNITLDSINEWKIQINLAREKGFEDALHTIDMLIDEYTPISASQEQHEHFHEAFVEINEIEEELHAIQRELNNPTYNGVRSKKILHSRLASLEKASHLLNLDLRLTHDLSDRLQAVLNALEHIEKDHFFSFNHESHF